MENQNSTNQSIPTSDAPTKPPFYQSTWFIILMTFCCCFPIGLFLMWKYKKFNQTIRIIITLFFALIIIGNTVSTSSSLKKETTPSMQETTIKEESKSEESSVMEASESTAEPQTIIEETRTEKDLFIDALISNPNVTKEAAADTYDVINNALGFNNVTVNKNPMGTLFEIKADDYNLKVTVSDKLYMIICGDYNLYDDDIVKFTKQDLENRKIGNNQSNYYVIAQEIITNNLKNPSSARFCSINNCKMEKNEDYVAVKGYVDATNSFGAQVRSDFVVEFKVLDLASFSYEIVYINIDGNSYGTYVDLN